MDYRFWALIVHDVALESSCPYRGLIEVLLQLLLPLAIAETRGSGLGCNKEGLETMNPRA